MLSETSEREKVCHVYSLWNIISMIKARRMTCAVMGDVRYAMLVCLEEKRLCRWDNNTKTNLVSVECISRLTTRSNGSHGHQY